MVSLHESRVVLAKSRRLLVTSKRLLQVLEGRSGGMNNGAMESREAPDKSPSDCFPTKLSRLEFQRNKAPNEVEPQVGGDKSWNRPRQPR
jgi:hypothetical protein